MKKKDEGNFSIKKKEDIGHLFWELEAYEHFFPFYKSIMKKE